MRCHDDHHYQPRAQPEQPPGRVASFVHGLGWHDWPQAHWYGVNVTGAGGGSRKISLGCPGSCWMYSLSIELNDSPGRTLNPRRSGVGMMAATVHASGSVPA